MAVVLAGFFFTAGLTGSILGVGTATIAANVVLTAVSLAASYALSKLTQRRPSRATPAKQFQETIRQAVAPRRRSYGTVMVSGPMIFYEARGNYVYVLVAMNSGTIEAIEEWWVSDKQVLLNLNNEVETAPYVSNNRSMVKIEWARGYADQVASATLMAAFSEWTANHRLRGVAWTLMRLEKVVPEAFQKVYNNTTPSIRQVMRATTVYDPRDPGHDIDDPDTWESSENPVIQLLDYMTNTDGMWLARSLFDIDAFIEQADICDESVALKAGGSQRRYESGGTYELIEQPTEVIQRILDTCGGQLYVAPSGKVSIEVDHWYEPSVTITDDEIIAWEMNSGVGRLQSYRAIRSKYTSPQHTYKEQSTGAVTLPEVDETTVTIQDFDIPWVPSNGQALRLGKLKLWRDNPSFSGSLTLSVAALRLVGERRFRLTTSILDIDMVCEIRRLNISGDLTRIQIEFATLSQQGYAWTPATDELDPPPVPPDTSEDAPLTAPQNARVLTGYRGASMYAGLSWDPPASGRTPEIRYKHDTDDWVSLTPDERNFVEWGDLIESDPYTAEVRFRDTQGNVSSWSSVSFTADDDQTVPDPPTNLQATGGVEAISASAEQSPDAVAFVVEFFAADAAETSPSFSPNNFARAEDQNDGTDTVTFTQPSGSRKVWARARTVANQVSTNIGPITVTVTDAPTGGGGGGGTSGDGGSAGEGGGAGGTGGGNEGSGGSTDSGP